MTGGSAHSGGAHSGRANAGGANPGDRHNAGIASVRHVLEDVAILAIRADNDFTWQAGQHMALHSDGFEPRYYSIANAPGPGILPEIHVRAGAARGLSTYLARESRPGQRVTVEGPYGTLLLPAKHGDRPLVMIAGGLGIAPLRAMSEAALAAKPDIPLTLIWGTDRPQDQYLKDELEGWSARHPNFIFHSVTGTPVSLVTGDLLEDFSGRPFLLAGPPMMIRATKSLLTTKGVALNDIHHDPLSDESPPP